MKLFQTLFLAILTSCAAAASAAAPTELGSASVSMGVDLYQRIAAEEPGNIALSPISLMGAMAPVAAGARGETREAIGTAMRFPSGDVMQPAGALLRSLAEKREGARVDIANALWLADDLRLSADFVATAERELDSEVARVDFNNEAAAAAQINGWAAAKTEGRIEHVIDPPFTDTRLVITNAVYLLAEWAATFDRKDTSPGDFFTSKATVQAPMMKQVGEYRLVETDDVQVLDMPYRDARLTMSLVLPKRRDGLASFERSLSGDKLAGLLAKLDAASLRNVEVSIPKVEFKNSMPLNEPLKAMGMGIAFTDRADLSGIANERLAISRVLQSSFLKIDEKGTEAAAVTAIDIVVTGMMMFEGPVFRADHPFMFVLRDRSTGAVLFMGRIADPTAS